MNKTKHRTSGALPWRVNGAGSLEVLLIHRRKHQDWSIPKGKAEPGEADRECAGRELREETGFDCTLHIELPSIHYLDRKRRLKTVRYWAATVEDSRFTPNTEVDEARWLSPIDAIETLTQPRERAVVVALVALLSPSVNVGAPSSRETVLLVRGAAAVSRTEWRHHDDQRPLAELGRMTAETLTALRRLYAIDQVVSAPATRCIETVTPLARHSGLSVDVTPKLVDGHIDGALELLDSAHGRGVVVCTHEENVSGVLNRLCTRDGLQVDSRLGLRRGSAWVLSSDGSRYRSALYLPMPDILAS